MQHHGFSQITLGLLAVAAAGFGQTAAPAAAPLSFEVASVKPAPPLDPAAIASGKAHLGMWVDQARVDIGGAAMIGLICQAYKVKPYQVSTGPNGPNWLWTERYDIVAKMPEGATKDDVPQMLQKLLEDRFKLALHRDKRETPVYALVIGKSGLKMKEAPPDAPAAPVPTDTAPGGEKATAPPAKGEVVMGSGDNQVRMTRSAGGMTINSKDTGVVQVTTDNGMIHMHFERASMESLVALLSQYLDRPVVDLTELKGKYQASIDLSMADAMQMAQKAGMNIPPNALAGRGGNANANPAEAASDPSGSLFTSVQTLGLKLEPRKMPYEYLVVDHVEKTPTDN